MKLLYCEECGDIFSLNDKRKTCRCGKTFGKYIDDRNGIYGGPSICLGLDNMSFDFAIENQMIDGPGVKIDACVIPMYSGSIIKMDDNLLAYSFEDDISIIADWNYRINIKRNFLFGTIYKICKKLMEIKIKDKHEYVELTASVNKILEKLKLYYNYDTEEFEKLSYYIKSIAGKDQEFIKKICDLTPLKIMDELLKKYDPDYYKKLYLNKNAEEL
jgi:DNA-directed RNA polymerase subunit F